MLQSGRVEFGQVDDVVFGCPGADAVAASMLTAVYQMLRDGTHHKDLGASDFEHRSTEIRARRPAARIAKLGFEVELRALAEVA